MSHTLINLTLPIVIEEIENVLDEYPENPYQLAFSIHDRTYANNSRNPDSTVGAIHELPLPRVLLRKSYMSCAKS